MKWAVGLLGIRMEIWERAERFGARKHIVWCCLRYSPNRNAFLFRSLYRACTFHRFSDLVRSSFGFQTLHSGRAPQGLEALGHSADLALVYCRTQQLSSQNVTVWVSVTVLHWGWESSKAEQTVCEKRKRRLATDWLFPNSFTESKFLFDLLYC